MDLGVMLGELFFLSCCSGRGEGVKGVFSRFFFISLSGEGGVWGE